jgi:hypothetical protein
MSLKEWLLIFLKSSGSFDVEDCSIEDSRDFVLFKRAGVEKVFFVAESLESFSFDKIKNFLGKNIVIVSLSSKKNIDWLVSKWDKLLEISDLSFIFVDLESSEKWSLRPKTHNLVTERNCLKKGLLSIFEGFKNK